MWKLVYLTSAEEAKCLLQEHRWAYGTMEFQFEKVEFTGLGNDRQV